MDLLSLFLIVVAVVIGVVVFKANSGSGSSSQTGTGGASLSGPGADALTIENVHRGGVLSLRAVGENLDDLDVTVLGRHVYDENGFRWFELEGDAGDRKVWITVERDDELEVSITLRKLRLDDLGLDKAKLETFDDEEQGRFEFEGKTFHYEDSDEAVMFRNGDERSGERFYYWEFEADDESTFVTVERWQDGSFECHVSQPLGESQITVFSLRENSPA